jgi:hypothetical protein
MANAMRQGYLENRGSKQKHWLDVKDQIRNRETVGMLVTGRQWQSMR